ncbi:MAG TPA: hypothetical protein VN426_08475 [Syntrophomonadaceae bacterium]|nr:hypothetical protein [Syntrophomonadaceae bacterium]
MRFKILSHREERTKFFKQMKGPRDRMVERQAMPHHPVGFPGKAGEEQGTIGPGEKNRGGTA